MLILYLKHQQRYMAKIKFREIKMKAERLGRLKMINTIIEDYQRQGYKLTLRQLYYQLVSREVIPNRSNEYDNLGTLLTDGRMCGLVDWNAIEDRMRVPSSPPSFDNPEDAIDAVTQQYQLPRMQGQGTYIEVWVEKDALSGVLKRVTRKYHIPIMVNRGYSSASAMYDAYNRFKQSHLLNNQKIRILYLGDYDPSGLDMIRDIKERILEFFGNKARLPEHGSDMYDEIERKFWIEEHENPESKWYGTYENEWREYFDDEYLPKNFRASNITVDFDVTPIALTRDQINQYKPPPNPAKKTDVRYAKYAAEHGKTSWEVDALRPDVLNKILTDAIEGIISIKKYNSIVNREKKDIKRLLDLKVHL